MYETGLKTGDDGLTRCLWAGDDPLYQVYHDQEWGQPVDNDTRLFEKICLEGFQSGLSWLTILKKRENFRQAFANFDHEKVATFSTNEIEMLLQNKGIIRHRGKISATINNAKQAIVLEKEFDSLARYFWQFKPTSNERPTSNSWQLLKSFTTTASAENLAKDLKRRGWQFVGPTTIYSFMQAMGMVNDHVEGCFCYERISGMQSTFKIHS